MNVIAQVLISAGAALFGVGVGVGLFKGTIKQIQKDVLAMQNRQDKLRGADNGNIPLYMGRDSCLALRDGCGKITDSRMKIINKDLKDHTCAIKSLNNFARWWMQKSGLEIDEINKILSL